MNTTTKETLQAHVSDVLKYFVLIFLLNRFMLFMFSTVSLIQLSLFLCNLFETNVSIKL